MAYDLNDIEEYRLGSPFWAGLHDRIYVEDCEPAKSEFIDDFEQTETGRRFFEMYGPDTVQAAWLKAIGQFKSRNGNEITFRAFVQFVEDLILSGGLVAPEPAQPEPKKLSSSQLTWQEYRIFSETHSSAQCTARARSDAGYAGFMQKNYEREIAETPVPDAVVNLNQKAATTNRISPQLQRFAEDYRVMPSDRVKYFKSPATNPGGAAGATEWNHMLDLAIQNGLV